MISSKQIKAARVFLGWDQRDLATKSGLSLPTIQRVEKIGVGRSSADNVARLQHAMEAAGIVFVAGEGSEGVCFTTPGTGKARPRTRSLG